jgi:hypothetical protein
VDGGPKNCTSAGHELAQELSRCETEQRDGQHVSACIYKQAYQRWADGSRYHRRVRYEQDEQGGRVKSERAKTMAGRWAQGLGHFVTMVEQEPQSTTHLFRIQPEAARLV